jgi:hypothetical protein
MKCLGLTQPMVTAACGAFAVLATVACQSAPAKTAPPARNIQVDVASLRANAGEPTASWVQQGLPDQLGRALAGHTTEGGPLVVRIDYVTFGPIKDSSAWDNISGVAMIGGRQWPVRATTRYQASATDQVLFEQSNHRRVTLLMQALSDWLARDL